jgi:hypothetical protein
VLRILCHYTIKILCHFVSKKWFFLLNAVVYIMVSQEEFFLSWGEGEGAELKIQSSRGWSTGHLLWSRSFIPGCLLEKKHKSAQLFKIIFDIDFFLYWCGFCFTVPYFRFFKLTVDPECAIAHWHYLNVFYLVLWLKTLCRNSSGKPSCILNICAFMNYVLLIYFWQLFLMCN